MSSSLVPTTKRLWLSWATVVATAPRSRPSPWTKPRPIEPEPPWRSMLAALARSRLWAAGTAPSGPAPRRRGARSRARRGPCRSRGPARSRPSPRSGDLRRERTLQVDGLAGMRRAARAGAGRLRLDRAAVGDHEVRAQLAQVLDEEDVGAAAGRDRADVVAAAEVLGGVDGRELDREQRVQARLDRGADRVVEVAGREQRPGVHVVGDEQRVAAVDAVLGQHLHALGDVVPGAALAELDPHAGAELGERVLAVDGLVVGVDAGAHVGVEAMVVPAVEAPVPGDRQAGVEDGADHLVRAASAS